MTNYALKVALCLLLLIPASLTKAADSPEGEWLVKDKTAHIRVLPCGEKLWGVISWVSEPGKDSNNPDPAKRERDVMGIPILLAMTKAEEGWDGDIYNADNGKIYHGNITLSSPEVLHVKGCFTGHWLCGGEDWTRLQPQAKSKDEAAICNLITH